MIRVVELVRTWRFGSAIEIAPVLTRPVLMHAYALHAEGCQDGVM